MASETMADIVAEMRRGTKLPGYWRSCDVNEILQYHADRIEAAWRSEREEWSSRLADAHEVAEDFKNTLTKALDTLAWLKSAESPAARGCKTESEAK